MKVAGCGVRVAQSARGTTDGIGEAFVAGPRGAASFVVGSETPPLGAVASLSDSDNIGILIRSFGNRLAENLFEDRSSRSVRAFDPQLRRVARRKLLYLHDAAELGDLRMPPGNRLEALKGDWKGFHSIRINDQWRLVFRWRNGDAFDVQIVDYHR